MVVDDDTGGNESLKLALEGLEPNFEVICSESGEKCIKLLENNQIPDLILLDIMMPGISGWQVYDVLKRNPLWEKIPIIFLTAKTDKITKETGSFFGDDYIEKPYEIEYLMERINWILNR